ncbi:hypothetical protein [Flavobacterium sp. N3904]|uniref:hypothetical protein n=1 Tax=Flavobacterium sp. N3904 TaxID=2986835 RepID=UPI0022253B75|nr:hypothetical protein [Flavobacterium sp. N3904]
MKYLYLTPFLFFLSVLNTQSLTLSGRYYVDFETGMYKDGYIDFKDNKFTLKHFNLLPYTDKIEYTPNTVYLKINSDVFFSIRNEEVKKDTIKFYIHSKIATPTNYMDVAIGSGKFIKVN